MPQSEGGAPQVAIIGASFAGLFAAAAVAAAGGRATLIERDALPDTAEPRRGVPQGPQPHVLLHRGLLAMRHLLPGLDEDLIAAGAWRLDTGRLPWLSPYGWMPTDRSSYDIYSLSRPLLELLVRRRVLALPGVSLRDGARVDGLGHAGNDWEVHLADGAAVRAEIVIDASGRTSRLPQWLEALGCPPPPVEQIEARLGYASRRYRNDGELAWETGVVLLGTPEQPRGAVVLPVEDDRWLLLATGYGEPHRPGRDPADFDRFLTTLADPVVSQLATRLEPEGEIAVHRQTGNQRRNYGRRGGWPAGLLAVGDSLCAFNPIYGQGISVAACQAELLPRAINELTTVRSTRRWQRRIAAVTDFPWAVATSEDLRFPSANGRLRRSQRLTERWTDRMSALAVGGDEACLDAFGEAYHLMGSPLKMFAPRVVTSVARSLVRGLPTPALRPAVLDELISASGTDATR